MDFLDTNSSNSNGQCTKKLPNTFLSRTSPKLKLHQWIKRLNAYDFLNHLCQADVPSYQISDPKKVKEIENQFQTESDLKDINLLRNLINVRNDNKKELIYNTQIERYNDIMKLKKMVIKITPSNPTDPPIKMFVHNIVMDIFLIERTMSPEEQEKSKDSWIGFMEITSDMSVKKDNGNNTFPHMSKKSDYSFGFKDYVMGQNILTDQLHIDKIKFDAYVYYMKYIIKDPEYQDDSNDSNDSDDNDGDEPHQKLLTLEKHNVHAEEEKEEEEDYEEFWQTFEKDLVQCSERITPGSSSNTSISDIKNEESLYIQLKGGSVQNVSSKPFETGSLDVVPITDVEGKMILPPLRMVPYCLNLQTLAVATTSQGSQYNQRKFASVNHRSTIFPLTVVTFPYGSISSTGSTHEIASMLSFQNILNMLREIYGPLAFEDPYMTLKNLVLTGYIGYPVSRQYLLKTYPSYFEKIDDFSGIEFEDKINRTDKSTVLVFGPGKLCYPGAKSIEAVEENMNVLEPMLYSARLTPELVAIEDNLNHSWPKKATAMLNRSLEKKSNKRRHKKDSGSKSNTKLERTKDTSTNAKDSNGDSLEDVVLKKPPKKRSKKND
jgi:TATA-box binding protein (TBP) (component of TFIID and TFIIIB)